MLSTEKAYERRWYTLGVICLSLIVITIDNTILNVALPTIVRDLGATGSQLQWIVDAYVLVFACMLLTAGALGDKYGRKGALTVGIVIFGAFSVVASFAWSPGMLIASRALMGVGAAFIFPTTLSILTNTFTGQERARAIGIWAGVSGVGVAIGPVLGGWLVETFSWGAVFLVNVPVCTAALILGYFFVPTSRDPANRAFDPIGALLSVAFLVALLYGIIEVPQSGWTAPAVLVSLAIGLAFLGLFAIWEMRTRTPMLDVRVFANPRFSAASAVLTLTTFALFGSIFLIIQYFQFALGYSPVEAGMLAVPLAIGVVVCAPNAPRLAARWGTKAVVVLGLSILAFALCIYASDTIMSSIVGGGLARLVFGIGLGLTMAPATESIMGSLPPSRAGVGSAINDTTRETGGALGVAVIGSIFLAWYHHFAAKTVGLSRSASAAVHDSIGTALVAARKLPHAQAAEAVHVSHVAFLDAMRVTYPISAAIVLLAAGIAWRYLPARATHEYPVFDEHVDVAMIEPVEALGL